MNRAKQAALRIALILEEFSPDEIRGALAILRAGSLEDLPTFLESTSGARRSSALRNSTESEATKEHRGESQALRSLKESDPEKYSLLRRFESEVRAGRMLPTIEDFRLFGRSLGKDFTVGKARKDAVGRLIALLAPMSLAKINEAVAQAAKRSTAQDDAYTKLAEHIVSGPRQGR